MPVIRAIAVSSLAITFLLKILAPNSIYLGSYSWTCSIFFFVQLLGYVFWLSVLYPKFFSPLRHLPGPSGGIIFMGQFRRILKEGHGDCIRAWTEEVTNNGLIRYLHLFNRERVAVVSPKGLAEVLVSKNYEFTKPPQMIKTIGRILGVGLFLAEGDEHKQQRKDLLPAFAFRHVKNLYPTFWDKSLELVEALKVYTEQSIVEKTPEMIVDVNDWASRATLDIIGAAGLGHDFHAIKDPGNDLNQTYRKLFSPTPRAYIGGIVSQVLPGWFTEVFPLVGNGSLSEASRTIKNVCKSLIEEKRQVLSTSGNKDVDILSVAIQSGGFSTEDLVNQLMTFLVAGHETTASSFTWAIGMLCQHPEMQTRLRGEVRTHLESSLDKDAKRAVTPSEIDDLPYLNAICNETLRLFPPVPLTFRVAVEDNMILGQYIPKGTRIIISPWAVNANRELWGDDAAEFNPERWMRPGTANTGGAESNYSFLTFLHGPRSCIGQGFAKAEMACLLAVWVATFETQLADPDYVLKVQNGITSRPKDFKVKLKEVQ